MNHILYSTPLNHENTYLNTIILAFDSLSNRTNFHDRLFIMLNILCIGIISSLAPKKRKENLLLTFAFLGKFDLLDLVMVESLAEKIQSRSDSQKIESPKKVNATKKNEKKEISRVVNKNLEWKMG